jgi:hypothetical protein
MTYSGMSKEPLQIPLILKLENKSFNIKKMAQNLSEDLGFLMQGMKIFEI